MPSVLAIVVLIIVAIVLVVLVVFLAPGLTGAPYVPSQQADLETAFTELYKLSKKDLLVDLGSGDGIVLQAATAHGATAIGVEINPIMTLITRLHLRQNKSIKIRNGNMYTFSLPAETTVVYAYANNLVVPRLYRRVQSEANRLGKTLYFISNAFDHQRIKPTKHIAPYYLYKITPQKYNKHK